MPHGNSRKKTAARQWFAVVVPRPNANCKVWGVSKCPSIHIVISSTSFYSYLVSWHLHDAYGRPEYGGTQLGIRKNFINQPRVLRLYYPLTIIFVFFQNLSLGVFNLEDEHRFVMHSLCCQNTICSQQLNHSYLSPSEH